MRVQLRKGLSSEEIVNNYNKREKSPNRKIERKNSLYIPAEYRGVEYGSIKSLADTLGLDYSRLINLVRRRKLPIETAVSLCKLTKKGIYIWARKHNKVGITIDGREFANRQQVYTYYKTYRARVKRNMEKGYTFEEAVKIQSYGLPYKKKN
ncbi:hypothetical protein D3C71_1549630 [compost metagenome]